MVAATQGRDRIDTLDALRGLALFGILMANILYWSGWSFMPAAQQQALAGVDGVVWQYRFNHLLIDGKFYTIFSLLFGAGFALQIGRLQARGADGMRIYRRRVLVLLGIGLTHSLLIWDGDILTLYALLGMLLPLFYGWSERRLLIAAGLLIFVVPIIGVWLFHALGFAPHRYLYGIADAIVRGMGIDPATDKVLEWFQRDDFRGWAAWQGTGWIYAWALKLETWRIPKVLGIMMIGLVVGRRLVTGTLLENRALLQRVLAGGLVVGVPGSLAYALIGHSGQDSLPSLIGTVPLALAYAAGFALAWPQAKGVLRHLAPVGRMALTNYLTHSLIGLVFFYGIGFGLAGRFTPLQFYAIAVMIFAAQMVFSRWWLDRHEQGPMEALWRRATYAGLAKPQAA
ncbi:DUF418 domain-containing protein [Porphyrobacter sp. LM 6]|uniref:DUF418 domain-containing protein n=1 Tax=Porphyrobacter sp. LM 6 TaxID=1896196 RepID=UPI000863A3B6|nr:DUF418 domain-containing protein [Porphyrobacter sp. LM 6]AOL95062.1 uncharacterized protein BG023_112146 [Porphyrobacter sp. LM 6]